MRRTDKYPETDCFHYHNQNPKNRMGCDCVARAISLFLGIPWDQCIRELTECGIKHGYVHDDPKCFDTYLASKGFFKMSQPRRDNGKKYTAGEFCRELTSIDKTYILSMANHLTCVVNNKVWDIWDCTDKCVGNYWVK